MGIWRSRRNERARDARRPSIERQGSGIVQQGAVSEVTVKRAAVFVKEGARWLSIFCVTHFNRGNPNMGKFSLELLPSFTKKVGQQPLK